MNCARHNLSRALAGKKLCPPFREFSTGEAAATTKSAAKPTSQAPERKPLLPGWVIALGVSAGAYFGYQYYTQPEQPVKPLETAASLSANATGDAVRAFQLTPVRTALDELRDQRATTIAALDQLRQVPRTPDIDLQKAEYKKELKILQESITKLEKEAKM
eukprot:jgi/Mesvir1/16668/Mv15070-RA.1